MNLGKIIWVVLYSMEAKFRNLRKRSHFIDAYRKCITSLIRTNSLIGTEFF